MIKFYKALLIISSAALTNCYSPASANPVGDTFTYAGNAIGKVVNSIVPQAPAPATTPSQYPVPSNNYPAR